jgi:hypothetical protein
LYRADLKVLHLAERDVPLQEILRDMSCLAWLYHR